jgi:O-methyltransferase
MKDLVQRLLRPVGLQLRRRYPRDFSREDIEIIKHVEPFTRVSPEQLYGCIRAVEYIVRYEIPGDIVECGVWKGGSAMALALTLLRLGNQSRCIYLYDTFEGMTAPSESDVDFRGKTAASELARSTDRVHGILAYSPLEEAEANILSTGYDKAKVQFIKGKVEETLPAWAPERVSLLRLDTDWYESTRHELVHLFPRVSRGGILMIDDYGHWRGVRKATDEYLAQEHLPLFLNRLDYAARVAVKI